MSVVPAKTGVIMKGHLSQSGEHQQIRVDIVDHIDTKLLYTSIDLGYPPAWPLNIKSSIAIWRRVVPELSRRSATCEGQASTLRIQPPQLGFPWLSPLNIKTTGTGSPFATFQSRWRPPPSSHPPSKSRALSQCRSSPSDLSTATFRRGCRTIGNKPERQWKRNRKS